MSKHRTWYLLWHSIHRRCSPISPNGNEFTAIIHLRGRRFACLAVRSRLVNGELGGTDAVVLCDQATEDWLKRKLNRLPWSMRTLTELLAAAVRTDLLSQSEASSLQRLDTRGAHSNTGELIAAAIESRVNDDRNRRAALVMSDGQINWLLLSNAALGNFLAGTSSGSFRCRCRRWRTVWRRPSSVFPGR